MIFAWNKCIGKLHWESPAAPKPVLPMVPVFAKDKKKEKKKVKNTCEIGFVGGGHHHSLVTITTTGSNCEIGP